MKTVNAEKVSEQVAFHDLVLAVGSAVGRGMDVHKAFHPEHWSDIWIGGQRIPYTRKVEDCIIAGEPAWVELLCDLHRLKAELQDIFADALDELDRKVGAPRPQLILPDGSLGYRDHAGQVRRLQRPFRFRR